MYMYLHVYQPISSMQPGIADREILIVWLYMRARVLLLFCVNTFVLFPFGS